VEAYFRDPEDEDEDVDVGNANIFNMSAEEDAAGPSSLQLFVPAGISAVIEAIDHGKLRLQTLLQSIISYCKAHTYIHVRDFLRDQFPMTKANWALMVKVNINFLIDLYVPAMGNEMLSVLWKKRFTIIDLSLISNNGDRELRFGVYAIVLQNLLEQLSKGYSGSSMNPKGLRERKWGHSTHMNAKNAMPKKGCRALYEFGRLPDTVFRMRVLATFSNNVPQAYVYLLERAMCIWLNTSTLPDYQGQHNPEITYQFVDKMRKGE
jgi:hypothetical protein